MKAKPPEPQPRPERRLSLDPREDRVLALSLAYLDAGLPAEEAFDSACADFACGWAADSPPAAP